MDPIDPEPKRYHFGTHYYVDAGEKCLYDERRHEEPLVSGMRVDLISWLIQAFLAETPLTKNELAARIWGAAGTNKKLQNLIGQLFNPESLLKEGLDIGNHIDRTARKWIDGTVRTVNSFPWMANGQDPERALLSAGFDPSLSRMLLDGKRSVEAAYCDITRSAFIMTYVTQSWPFSRIGVKTSGVTAHVRYEFAPLKDPIPRKTLFLRIGWRIDKGRIGHGPIRCRSEEWPVDVLPPLKRANGPFSMTAFCGAYDLLKPMLKPSEIDGELSLFVRRPVGSRISVELVLILPVEPFKNLSLVPKEGCPGRPMTDEELALYLPVPENYRVLGWIGTEPDHEGYYRVGVSVPAVAGRFSK